jgi:dolichyl-phosphate-mannose--protein O-mannosyl transferase
MPQIELVLDTSQIKLVHPYDGRNLTARRTKTPAAMIG